MKTPAGIGVVGRFYAEFERPEWVRFSHVQSDPPMLDKDHEGQSGGADGDPSVAVPAVVASNFGVVVSSGSHSGTEQRPVVGRDGHQPPAFSSRVPSIGRMDLQETI